MIPLHLYGFGVYVRLVKKNSRNGAVKRLPKEFSVAYPASNVRL